MDFRSPPIRPVSTVGTDDRGPPSSRRWPHRARRRDHVAPHGISVRPAHASLQSPGGTLRRSSRTAERRPSEAVVRGDRQVVLEAMAHLSPQLRAAIFRSYYLGWTISQIATDMQTTEGVVHCRLHVALRALQAEI